mgnify:CR=1 FL=1
MNNIKELLNEDRNFCLDFQKNGIDAWIYRLKDYGIMVNSSGPVLTGKEEVKESLIPLLSLKSLEFTWEPIGGNISDDETLGYTYGNYNRSFIDSKEKEQHQTGRYTTIWRKDSDGRWKIELDIGN